MADWCTIESDPGVFTELIQKIGVKDVQVEELWSLGDDDFAKLKPVYGLIFLFKWRSEVDERPIDSSVLGDIFFARQIISNACATQALLSILLNHPDIDVGDALGDFRSFAKMLDPETAGEAINGLDSVRIAHNSFNRPEPFLAESKQEAGPSDDVFHFIAYVPFKGKVYELDGLKQGPICLGEYTDDWLSSVRPHIEQRIQRYSTTEIRFNLMAVVKDQRKTLSEEIDARQARIKTLEKALGDGGDEKVAEGYVSIDLTDNSGFEALLASKDLSQIKTQLNLEKRDCETAINEVKRVEDKFAQWKQENIRRKHNYIPFCVAMLRHLAKHDKLEGLVKNATDKAAQAAASKAGGDA